MRLLHLADVHIGVERYGHPATEADIEALPAHFAPGAERSAYLGMPTRLLDFLAALDEAVAYALDDGVDAVLFAGDAYRSRDPSQTHQREFARRIARLSAAGVPVHLTVGNHDLPHVAGRATALEIFPTLDVANVTVGASVETHVIATRSGPLQVVSVPWVRIGSFMAREETRGLTLEQVREQVEERLAHFLAEEVARLDPALPAALCAHVNIAGATAASERSMMLGNDHVLGLGTVAIPAFDYVALGNIHKHQVLAQRPPVVYPGSIERVDFSEESEDKGFVIVELDLARPQGERVSDWRLVPVDARPMRTLAVRVAPGAEPTGAALAAIEREEPGELARAIVRMRVEMDAEAEPGFREAEVRRALAGACFHVAGVERAVERGSRARLSSGEAAGMGPLEALGRYFAARNVSTEREAELTRYARALLEEEQESGAY